MAKDYKQMAEQIVEQVGGESNVISLTHCMTRLRFQVKDEKKVNMDALKQVSGVIQVVISGDQYQVVIGSDVADVYDQIGAIGSIPLNGEEKETSKKNIVSIAIDTVSGIFMPFMSAFMAAGLLKGLLVLVTAIGVLDKASTTYTLLYAAADGVFYFLPFFLAHTAGKKFNANPYIAMGVAAALVYPNITNLYSSGEAAAFMGIPVTLINYTSSVIPIIVAVFVQSKLEKLLKRVLPKVIQGVLVPLVSLLTIILLTFLVVGPAADFAATKLANSINFLLNLSPVIAGAILGLCWPVMIIFGLHWGVIPIVMNNYATFGVDNIMPIVVATGFAITGACLAIFVKTKNPKLKQFTGSAVISAFLGGVTEPAIYGAVLKYKKPFAFACIGNAISGAIIAAAGCQATAMFSGNLLTLPAVVAMYAVPGAIGMGVALVVGFVGTYFFGFNDNMLSEKENN